MFTRCPYYKHDFNLFDVKNHDRKGTGMIALTCFNMLNYRQWLLTAGCHQRIRYCQPAVTSDFAADSQYNLWSISYGMCMHLRVTVTLTSRLSSLSGRCHHDLLDSILEKSCPEHISYIICGMNPKFSE